MSKSDGELVPQPHGGALKRGGIATPGPGAPASALRAAARLSLEERLPVLAEIIDNPASRDSDRIAAIRELARIGLGNAIPTHEVREKLRLTTDSIYERLGDIPHKLEPLMNSLRDIWAAK